MTSFHKNMQARNIIAMLMAHTDDCTDFRGYSQYKADRANYQIIECTCGQSYSLDQALYNEAQWKNEVAEYIQASSLFNSTIRQRAIVNQTPLEEVISPILGMCLDCNEEIEWEAEYL